MRLRRYINWYGKKGGGSFEAGDGIDGAERAGGGQDQRRLAEGLNQKRIHRDLWLSNYS